MNFVRIPKTGSTAVSLALFGEQVDHQPASFFGDGFKFTFVRSPYERARSAFAWWQAHTPLTDKPFSEWVQQIDPAIPQFEPMTYYIDAPVDFIGRHERMQEDFDALTDRLGLPRKTLPRVNVASALHYYTDAARQKVREVYADDFTRFGYH